jgi:hypothetical protein
MTYQVARRLGGRRESTRRRLALRPVLGLALLLVIPVSGQQGSFPQVPAMGGADQQFPNPDGLAGPNDNTLIRKRVEWLNDRRQKQLVSDTEKLLKLAQELNAEVAANDSDSMSPSEMRKVAEIAKLAKSVREKMSDSMIGAPVLDNPPLTMSPQFQ